MTAPTEAKAPCPLAVIDELAATYGPNATPFPKLSRVTEARAKVAELVAADRALDAANHALATTAPQSEDAETISAMRAHRDHCRARRHAALAAFSKVQS